MLAAFVKKDMDLPLGLTTETGGRLIVMDKNPQGRLYFRLALFEEKGTSACVICSDLKFFSNEVADAIRHALSGATGIPVEHILLSASHTHTVPDITLSNAGMITGKLIDSILEARNKLVPVEKWISGSAMTEAWGICRRPFYRMPDGRFQVGSQGPRQSAAFAGLDGEDETVLRGMALKSANGGLVGGIANYACHPVSMWGNAFYCPDFPGALCDKLDQMYTAVFMYANGPNGNVAPAGGGPDFCRQMGESLALKLPEALAGAEELAVDGLRVFSETIEINRRVPAAGQIDFARQFLGMEPNMEEAVAFARKMYGFDYHFHGASAGICKALCRQLITLDEEIKAGKKSDQMTVQVIAVGELAIVGLSAEMFNQFSRRLRSRSPFKHHCVIQLANGWGGYVPPAESMTFGGYECCLGLISRLDPEAADIMLDLSIRLLEKASSGATLN